METVTIREAKARLSQLIAKACRGEEIIIMRGSEAVVRLVAIAATEAVRGERSPGALRGKLHVGPEFFAPLPADELALWGL
jgi:prevent-host-death family protein